MANTITFTPGIGSAVVVTPIPGSVKAGGGHDDRGGGTVPAARAGYAYNGSCQVVVTDATATSIQHTLTELKGLVSGVGEGDRKVEGAGLWANIKSWKALVDVEISGDSVQLATITWKGSATPGGQEG